MCKFLIILILLIIPSFACAGDWERSDLDYDNMEYLNNNNWRCRYTTMVDGYAFWSTWKGQQCPSTVYINVKTGEVRKEAPSIYNTDN